MRDVAIISCAQTVHARSRTDVNDTEMLMPLFVEALERAHISKDRVDFVCSGSSDYLAGQVFSFVVTLDGVGPWPPISESHVDMDGAWALYEAWVKMQMGLADVALIYSYGKSAPGDVRRVMSRQLEPYYTAPLWVDSISLAALQARAGLEAGVFTEEQMAEVAAASIRRGKDNPSVSPSLHRMNGTAPDVAGLLDTGYVVSPLRKHDCPPITDGAAAVVLAAGDVARELSERPAWIRAIDHRIEPHALGVRDLTTSVSTAQAAAKLGPDATRVDLAELHAPFSHQELILRDALGLGDGVEVNPSGGALAANPIMSAGLVRMGEAAARISAGGADRALAHATSGPCLQQNLVCLLEGDR